MNRRGLSIIWVLTVGLVAQPTGPDDEFRRQVSDFVVPFDKWLRKWQGCPPEGFDVALCREAMATNDAREWRRSREAAARLFGLREPK